MVAAWCPPAPTCFAGLAQPLRRRRQQPGAVVSTPAASHQTNVTQTAKAVGGRRPRREEPGCLRFDLLRDSSNLNKFYFYEVYVDTAAVDNHKATPHFKARTPRSHTCIHAHTNYHADAHTPPLVYSQAWSDFKDSGGVVSQTASKCTAIDFVR